MELYYIRAVIFLQRNLIRLLVSWLNQVDQLFNGNTISKLMSLSLQPSTVLLT